MQLLQCNKTIQNDLQNLNEDLLYENRYQERTTKTNKKLAEFLIWKRILKITEKVSVETWIKLAKSILNKKPPNRHSNDHSKQYPKAVQASKRNEL